MKYPVYERYKDSGVEWLGEVPEKWYVYRSKFFLEYIGSGKTPKGGSNVYVNEGIMLIRSQNVYDSGLKLDDVVFMTEEADELQANSRVKSNDVLLNITGASIGRTSLMPIGMPKSNVNQHVCILRPNNSMVLPKFLHQLLCSKIAKDQILSFENGTSREGLNFQQVANLRFPLPPLNDQKCIIKFIDYKTAQIDRLIEKKQALIEKLNEKRTALISRAVTKGLDESVPMKDSGVEWLGEVPVHWEAVALRFLIDGGTINGLYKSKEHFDDSGIPFVQMGEAFASSEFNTTAKDRVIVSQVEFDLWSLKKGDLLFARRSLVFEGSGKCTIVGDLKENHIYESVLKKYG